MPEKPTYEELEQLMEALTKEVSDCRLAEHLLKEQLKLLRQSEKIAHVGSYKNNLDKNEVTWSDEMYRLFGYEPGEVSPNFDLVTSHVHPDDRERFIQANRAFLAGNQEFSLEYRIVRKSGEIRTIRSKARMESDPSGAHKVRYGALLDITEQKETERALRESEERFRTAFYLSPDPVNINRVSDGLYVDINKGFTDATGYTREEVIEQESIAVDIWHDPRDREKMVDALKKDGIVRNLEAQFRLKGGNIRSGLISATLITLNGEPHILSIARDIHELKEAEKTLRESEEKYRQLVENANDAIFIAQDGFIRFANQKARDMTESSDEELKTTPFTDYIHPAYREMVLERHAKRQRGEETPSTYSFKIINRSGKELWVQLNSALITWEGKPATLNFLRDINEQKRLEVLLNRAQKMEALGTLSGGIAHDFNNLLMGIQGRTSLMLGDTDASHPHYEHLKGIEDYVKSAADLTRQLLGFARGGKYEVKPTNLNELIQKQNVMFGRTRKDISIIGKYDENLWTAEVDRGQIEQALLNLYVNAWQAMPAGGTIYIQTQNVAINKASYAPIDIESDQMVKISVTDTGAGMDEATRQRVFDPFFTTKEMDRGTGLGLASVYGIIKNHKGFITVYSEVGEGTTFNIYLPASTKKAAKVKASIIDSMITGSGTVLIVDDEEMIRTVAEQMVKRLGYQVITADNGESAVEIYKNNSDGIDLIILDMIMPKMGGGPTYDRLKKINP